MSTQNHFFLYYYNINKKYLIAFKIYIDVVMVVK